MFRTEEKARQWSKELHWPNKPQFTVRIGIVMQKTHLKYRKWTIGLYPYSANIKGVSLMRLHREIGISQKSVWLLLHRLCTAAETDEELFSGSVEANEIRIGGKHKNIPKVESWETKDAGRIPIGKEIVVDVRDRITNKVWAKVVLRSLTRLMSRTSLHHRRGTARGSTGEAKVYNVLKTCFDHETVNHFVREYVWSMAGKYLFYEQLMVDSGLSSGARL